MVNITVDDTKCPATVFIFMLNKVLHQIKSEYDQEISQTADTNQNCFKITFKRKFGKKKHHTLANLLMKIA